MFDVRLIDANALQRAFDDAHKDKPDYYCCNFLNNAGNPSTEWDCVDDILENAPTIDAQPVKRGRWETVYEHTAIVRIDGIGYETKPKDYVVCSVCGKSSKRADNFCGNCGAKMDGGDAK